MALLLETQTPLQKPQMFALKALRIACVATTVIKTEKKNNSEEREKGGDRMEIVNMLAGYTVYTHSLTCPIICAVQSLFSNDRSEEIKF